jgi:uncharacterized protein
MTSTSAPGVPFHRLARTAAHRWWRPLVGTVVLVVSGICMSVAVYAAASAAAIVAERPTGADGLTSLGEIADFMVDLVVLAGFIPCVLFTVWWVQRRPVGTVSSVQGRLRLRWLGVCLLASVPALVLMMIGADLLLRATGDSGPELTGDWVGAGEFVIVSLLLLVLVPLQAAAEEYVCRGWLLQAVGAVVRAPWLPIGVQAAVFAAIHGAGTAWGLADLVVFGAVTGWLAVRTGGLEAGIALHVVNNLMAMIGSAAFGALVSDETVADAPWQILAVDAPLLLAYAAAITWLARRRGLVTLAPATEPPAAVLQAA